jgi:hypothetical protein
MRNAPTFQFRTCPSVSFAVAHLMNYALEELETQGETLFFLGHPILRSGFGQFLKAR